MPPLTHSRLLWGIAAVVVIGAAFWLLLGASRSSSLDDLPGTLDVSVEGVPTVGATVNLRASFVADVQLRNMSVMIFPLASETAPHNVWQGSLGRGERADVSFPWTPRAEGLYQVTAVAGDGKFLETKRVWVRVTHDRQTSGVLDEPLTQDDSRTVEYIP